MGKQNLEKIFPADVLSKRERVEATLDLRPVDRIALHDQIKSNPDVVSLYAGKRIVGFDYTLDDVCLAARRSLDMTFPPAAPIGTGVIVTDDGFSKQCDNWTSWVIKRPFDDIAGAQRWLWKNLQNIKDEKIGANTRVAYHDWFKNIQQKIGQTVLLDYPINPGLPGVYSDLGMGLELFVYFCQDNMDLLREYMEVKSEKWVQKLHVIADRDLSPAALIAEDIATTHGTIFSPDFLRQMVFPYVRNIAAAWHEHDIKVLYHSDGNWKKVIPDLIACGVDGFYCLEKNCGMDIVELKNAWPDMVWAGGVDGVDLMERGTPEQVRAEALRHISETDALHTGGMFVGSSSEINPPIPAANFKAMVDAANEIRNK